MNNQITKHSDIPKTEHYAIVMSDAVYYKPTNPSVNPFPIITYHVYMDKEEWEKEIRKLTQQKKLFNAMRCTPAVIETVITVN